MQCRKSRLALRILKGVVIAIVLFATASVFASTQTTYTETLLWSFDTNYPLPDGAYPNCNGLVFDKSGNLFGITASGGLYNLGVVFELSPNGQGGWNEILIHTFDPYSTSIIGDGAHPCGSLAIDRRGNLYGTTLAGGTNNLGTVYELSPNAGGVWTENILYSFGDGGSNDGSWPVSGVTLKSGATVLYGTTECGGTGPNQMYYCPGSGTVYRLSYTKPTKKVKGRWQETILHNFSGPDGYYPFGGLLLNGGNLYGTTTGGGRGAAFAGGVVFELQAGAGGWAESTLYNFGATAMDAGEPYLMTPVMDAEKNIYGTTCCGGSAPSSGGTAWELVYSSSNNTYSEKILYSFGTNANDGINPNWGIVKGVNGWFGATGGWPCCSDGNIFELNYSKKKGWQETIIFSQFANVFDGSTVDLPGYNELIMDKSGNLYGMGNLGGWGYGGVFELKP
jgi:uncharacterized repeat protein (TIGR03803 family)